MTIKLSPGNAKKASNFDEEFDRIFQHYPDEPKGIDEILIAECDCGCDLSVEDCLQQKDSYMRNRKIKSNKLMCKECNDIIESVHRHDFIWCSCESIFVDGGLDYLRRGGKGINNYEELSTYYD